MGTSINVVTWISINIMSLRDKEDSVNIVGSFFIFISEF